MSAARGNAGASAGQLELSGLPRPLLQVTPSKLTAFDCPRRYRFNYVDRPAPPKGQAWAHNTVGSVAHLALLNWFDDSPERRTPESAQRRVRSSWQHDGFRDDAMSAAWREQTALWVGQYAADELERRGSAHEPRGRERTVATRTAMLAFSGRVDRIDERDDELVIVDYKTGRSTLTDDDARGSLALALYAMATEKTLRQRCRTVELHHLPTGAILTYEHTDETFASHVERAEQTATDIIAAVDTVAAGADPDDVFEPKPGPGCSWCDFRSACPAGQAVSSRIDSWAGLATLENDVQLSG